MKPPKSVKVGPRTYTVHIKGKKVKTARDNAPFFLQGQAFHIPQYIIINPDQHVDQQRETLLHELLHCVFNVADNLDVIRKIDDVDDLEEALVRLISPHLYQVLRDNPALVAHLTEE